MTADPIPAGIVRRVPLGAACFGSSRSRCCGRADLLAADYPGERRSDHGPSADGPWAHRGRLVARPRKHRADAGPTPHDLAGGHDPVHALVRCRLERGDQWRLPHGRLTLAVAAVGDLPAGDLGAPLLLLSKRVGQVLDAMPATWLVALQLYRVFGSWALAAWLHGALPGVFALPAGTGDVLTGLFAVPAAIAVATGTAEGRRAAIIWNIFGLADFAVAITLGMITTPGPFQLIVPNGPSIGAGAYPGVLTPAFVVPSSILLHALSLRQLRRRSAW